MIKKIAFLLMFPALSHAVATTSIVVASAAVANAARQNEIMNQNLQSDTIAMQSNDKIKVKGVMICRCDYSSIPGSGAYIIDGCDNHETIEHFFKRNRRSEKDEIITVIYDGSHSRFIIYYGAHND